MYYIQSKLYRIRTIINSDRKIWLFRFWQNHSLEVLYGAYLLKLTHVSDDDIQGSKILAMGLP